jgi:hypothetical protein
VIAVRDDLDPELVREGGVIRTQLSMGRDRAARIAVAERGGAERPRHAYKCDTPPPTARARDGEVGVRDEGPSDLASEDRGFPSGNHHPASFTT